MASAYVWVDVSDRGFVDQDLNRNMHKWLEVMMKNLGVPVVQNGANALRVVWSAT